jgi:Intracellular proteinase inhibitor
LLINPLMRRGVASLFLLVLLGAQSFAQGPAPTPAPKKRGWLGRMLHPFSSSAPGPQYRDPRLRGLLLDLKIAPQPVKLSEVRQLEIRAILSNVGKFPITLDFTTDQRIEIYLRNSAESILTKWSDNHAVSEKAGTIVVNPHEQVEYKESIATREMSSNKVFSAEVFFPKYPEIRARQKFMTAP